MKLIAATKWFLILWVGSAGPGNISGPYTHRQCEALAAAHVQMETRRGYGEWFRAECIK